MRDKITSIFNYCREQKIALPAFNVTNSEMFRTAANLAQSLSCPIIISLSEAHLPYLSLEEAVALYKMYSDTTKGLIILHFDHGQTIEIIKQAIDVGFPSVMIDASADSFAENVKKTVEICDYAHKKNVFVEAEIGHVGSAFGTSEAGISDSIYTSVIDAKEFVKQTDVDSLAVSIGTAHGQYSGVPKLNFERLTEINENISKPLVLHGGSSSGDDNLRRAVEHGIVKINIFTDLTIAALESIDFSFDYVEIMKLMHDQMSEKMLHYCKLFGINQWKGA